MMGAAAEGSLLVVEDCKAIPLPWNHLVLCEGLVGWLDCLVNVKEDDSDKTVPRMVHRNKFRRLDSDIFDGQVGCKFCNENKSSGLLKCTGRGGQIIK